MTSDDHTRDWMDAVDAALSARAPDGSVRDDGDSRGEAVDGEVSSVAAALTELRSAYEAVPAPFVFDPREAFRGSRRVAFRRWSFAGASLAAAAVVMIAMLPELHETGVTPHDRSGTTVLEPVTQMGGDGRDRGVLPRTPDVLEVRTPSLAIRSSASASGDDGVARLQRGTTVRASGAMSFTRLKAPRLTITSTIDTAPWAFPRTPSMISKPRRKPHDNDADDDVGRGGSSDRQPEWSERLG